MTSSSNCSSSYFLRKLKKSGKFLQIVRCPDQNDYAVGLAESPGRASFWMKGKASMMFTRQQAADYFGVSLSTIQRLINARELEGIKVGRSVRISDKAIKTFMDRKRLSNER